MPEEEPMTRELRAEEFEGLEESYGLRFGDFVQSKDFDDIQGRIKGAKQVNGILSVVLDNGKEYYPDMVELISRQKP